MIKEMLKKKCAQSLIWLFSWEFFELKVFFIKIYTDLLKSFSNIFIYYSNVATIGFLCVLCVLLSAHDCVDFSMAKYVLSKNS
jgi:hypothetical protein